MRVFADVRGVQAVGREEVLSSHHGGERVCVWTVPQLFPSHPAPLRKMFSIKRAFLLFFAAPNIIAYRDTIKNRVEWEIINHYTTAPEEKQSEPKMTRIKCYEYVEMGEKKLIFNFSTLKGRTASRPPREEGQIKWLIMILYDWANKHDESKRLRKSWHL